MCTTVVESWEQCSDNGDLLVCAILKLQSITSHFTVIVGTLMLTIQC